MRMYQEIGLTPEAEEWLEENCEKIPSSICPHCGEVLSYKKLIIEESSEEAFYEDGPTLHSYKLTKNRGIVKEIIQAMPWSSGPCAFFCLQLENGEKLFEWPEEQINEV